MSDTNEAADGAPVTAGCSCGAVGIVLRGEPAFQAACACADCRSRSGSAFGISAYYPATQVVERRGAPRIYRRTSKRGRHLDFRFCETCGTTVWWTAEFRPDDVGVAAGLLEGYDAFRPTGAYFCDTKPDWVHFDEDIPVAGGATTQRS
ncbi:MAG: GFA family protein [Sandaracinaceae bacterium]